jgi:putative flippase GtrA
MYEPRYTPPVPVSRFVLRMAVHAFAALILIAISLFVGMIGYRHYEHMSSLDAFLNAAMLLGGMGPVKTDGLSDPGKLFAGIYALYSGLVLIAIVGIMLAPVVHRVLHRFHWVAEQGGE